MYAHLSTIIISLDRHNKISYVRYKQIKLMIKLKLIQQQNQYQIYSNMQADDERESPLKKPKQQPESEPQDQTQQQPKLLQSEDPSNNLMDFQVQNLNEIIDQDSSANIKSGNHKKQESEEYQDRKQDEKEQQQEWFGINKKLYRIDRDRTDPAVRTGIEDVLLPNNPDIIDYKEDQYQMFQPKPFILEDAIKRDIQIICFMSSLMKKIVYDLYQNPPLTKDISPKQHNVDVLPYYLPSSQTDTTLVFQSRFETGNLRRAIQLVQYQYQLILKTDWSTNGHTQWFYFSTANTRKDVQYKFTIINLMKPDSLYNSGMKPLFYSEKLAKNKKTGWFRDGYDICYYQNNLKRKNGDFYYSLNFSVKFPYDCDTVYIAHCYPYTYSKLQNFLKQLQADPKKKNLLQRKTLCQTVAGNNCDYLIISDFNNGKQKKGVFLTSRVHPGETMASYIIQYIIQFLLGNSSIAKVLRENFLFKIVPMLNIDGVIVGNYRCNLSQVDLNRQWIDPNKKLHPTIYHTKQMIKRMKEQRQLLLYCDFHGHSRKKNCFMYGCSKDSTKREQVFPAIMRTNCNTFAFKDCCFLIQKDREGASRIALWKQLNITNCYTLQVSFCGADAGKYEYKHFNLDNYRAMAQGFCLSIYDMYEPEQNKVKQVMSDLQQNLLKYEKFGDDDSGGDDSDYSNENNNKQVKEKTGENRDTSKNQIVIKKKMNPSIIPAKKKK